MFGPGQGPGRVLTGGGGALRVRQIGSFLHIAPYGPEQKCMILGNGNLAALPPKGRTSGGSDPFEGALF